MVLHSGTGQSQYLCVGWELLRHGGDGYAGVGGFRWQGAGGVGTTKPVVYNTVEEIRSFGEVLGKLIGG